LSFRIIIPARYGSTRFPGKPLALVASVPLVQRVWALGASVAGREAVAVTTDDKRIADFCARIGATCIMTDPAIPNGTGRVLAALQQLPGEVDQAINLQGDAVLTPPWVIRAIIEAMKNDPSTGVFTPAVRMDVASIDALHRAKAAGEVGGTTVTFDHQHKALYFSKSVIPYVRDGLANPPVYRHIGLYGYRRAALEKLMALPSGPLEQAEKLEQLRALENGMAIRVVEVDYRGRSHTGIDSESDKVRAEKFIASEGELLPTYNGSYRYPP